jgi:hypothetical protein
MGHRIILILFLSVISNSVLWPQSGSEKCGTFSAVRRLNDALSMKTDLPLTSRPVAQTSRITPNGKIRIHYDTTGTNQPALVSVSYLNGIKTVTRIPNTYSQYIDTLVMLFDSVWRAEIDQYGFTAPPADNGRGGGNEFDIYVMELGGGLFGVTEIEGDLPVGAVKTNQQYASFIRIDNDFGSGYRTNGIEAIMATAAHEFHHAVQIGGSGVWENQQFYFYELCAESMEHIVFSHAKDYLFDVKTYFKNISVTSLFQQGTTLENAGYERAIWAIFLMKNYGTIIMKDLWEEVKVQRPVPAVNTVLNNYSTSIQREFANFSYWNFFTAYRADSVKYYTDAKLYPAVPFVQTINAVPSPQQLSVATKSYTANYYKAVSNTDSAFFVISNTNYSDALNENGQLFNAQLSISTAPQSGFNQVTSGLFARFTAVNPADWSYIPFGITASPFCFPNPFRPAASSLLISPAGVGVADDVTLSIISAVSFDLVYSQKADFTTFSGTQYVEWNGRDDHNAIVPSGVYLYILSKGSTVIKGKFAVIR